MKATELSAHMDFDDARTLVQAYKNCFNSSAGKQVLAHMLFEMGYFSDSIEDPGEVAVRNFAARLVARLSGFDDNVIKAAIRQVVAAPLNESLLRAMKQEPDESEDE